MRIRDKRRRGFYITENVILDKWLGDMGPMGLVIYAILCRMADRDGTSFPSLATIAEKAHVTKQCVINNLKKLEGLGLIEVERRQSRRGEPLTNIYTIVDPPDDGPGPVNPQSLDDSSGSVNPDLPSSQAEFTIPSVPPYKDEQETPQQHPVGGGVSDEDIERVDSAFWKARTLPSPHLAKDRITASNLITEHGMEKAVHLVTVLGQIIADHWGDCKSLTGAVQSRHWAAAVRAVHDGDRHRVQARRLTEALERHLDASESRLRQIEEQVRRKDQRRAEVRQAWQELARIVGEAYLEERLNECPGVIARPDREDKVVLDLYVGLAALAADRAMAG